MTTAPQAGTTRPRRGVVGAVVLVALGVTVALGSLLAVVAGVTGGGPAVYGVIIGTVMVCVFFGLGALVLDTVAALAPSASLLIALLTYTLKVVLIGLVFLGLTRSGALETAVDARWLGGTVIASTLAWLAAQVVGSMRARLPIYDLPVDGAAEPSAGAAGDPGAGEAGAQ